MLPPFIIEQIRKREEQQVLEERPMLELPIDKPGSYLPMGQDGPRVSPLPEGEPQPRRGVIVLDL